jgi:phage recombination protein Bet
MSNVVALQTPSPLRPRDYDPSQLALIRRTVAADTTPDEFNMFIEIAKRAGLDPFRKQLYCIVYSKDDEKKRKVTFITGIDGFRAVAARNRDYRPDDQEPIIVTDPDAKDPDTNPLGIVKATVKAYKMAPSGEWFAVSGTAYWSEFCPLKDEWAWNDEKGKRLPTGRVTLDPKSNWFKMGRVMICKCAEAQALRKGWPEDLSGIYSPEEMERPMLDVTPTDAIEQHEQAQRVARVGGTNTIAMIWKLGEAIEAVPVGKLADRCGAHFRTLESVGELDWWWSTNEVSLRHFWALHKSDALNVKAEHEARKAALAG